MFSGGRRKSETTKESESKFIVIVQSKWGICETLPTITVNIVESGILFEQINKI